MKRSHSKASGFGGSFNTNPKAKAAWEALQNYHPYRYAAYRPWASKLLKEFKSINGGNLVATALVKAEEWDEKSFRFPGEKHEDPWGYLFSLVHPQLMKVIDEADPVIPYILISQLVLGGLRDEMMEYGQVERSPAQLAFSPFVGDEAKTFSHWATHALNHRALFDFTPELVNMFSRTDVGEAVLDQIHLPSEGVYLHFGIQPDFPIRGRLSASAHSLKEMMAAMISSPRHRDFEAMLPDGMPEVDLDSQWFDPEYFLEGAYVSRNRYDPEGSLEILLIGRRLGETFPPPPQIFLEVTGELIDYHLPCFYPGITVLESLKRERDRVDADHLKMLRETYEQMRRESRLTAIGPDLEEFDTWASSYEANEKQTRNRFEAALKLVINGLLYVTAYPEEVEPEYPPVKAPQIGELVAKIERPGLPPEAVSRYQKQLDELGYVKIKFCGRKIAKKAQELKTRNSEPGRQRTFKGRLGTWRFLDASGGHFKTTRHVWVRPSPDPTGTKPLTIYDVH